MIKQKEINKKYKELVIMKHLYELALREINREIIKLNKEAK